VTRERRIRVLGAASGAAVVVAAVAGYALVSHLAGGEASAVAGRQQAAVPPIVSTVGLERAKGIRIVHVAVSGAGGLLDLRYQVVDADKAAAVHASLPEMVDERSGAVVDQLLMGHQHKGTLRAGQTYYLIFENPGNLVQRGGRVTVALAGARVRHVRVE
jgi:hypothetical protein